MKYLDLPFVCKICAENHPQNLAKGRIFTYLEDPGIIIWPESTGENGVFFIHHHYSWVLIDAMSPGKLQGLELPWGKFSSLSFFKGVSEKMGHTYWKETKEAANVGNFSVILLGEKMHLFGLVM